MPAIGITTIGAPCLWASDTNPGSSCPITAADSVLLYQGLLDKVVTAATSFAGSHIASELRDCATIVNDLQSLLRKIQNALNNRNSSNLLDDLKTLAERTRESLQLTHTAGSSPQLASDLTAISELTATALANFAAECDTGTNTELTQLIQQIAGIIDHQSAALRRYERSMTDWNESAQRIDMLGDQLHEKLSLAGSKIAAVDDTRGSPDSQPLLNEAINTLSDVNNALRNQLAVAPGVMWKDTLIGMLTATIQIIQRDGVLHPAEYLTSTSADNLSVPSLDKVPPTVMDNVHTIIRDPTYFHPAGGLLQSLTCVAICLPVWFAYKLPGGQETRERLIRGSLFLVRGAITEQYGAIAQALAKADSRTT